MENRLARLWLGLLLLAATFSRSTQEGSCLRLGALGELLFCIGTTVEDIIDLRDSPGIGDRSSVQQIIITGSQIGNFTNEVLLLYPQLRIMRLTRNNISPDFFPAGVFKNVNIEELLILENNVEYNNHFAKVINDLEVLKVLDLTDNPIRNFDSAAIETFDRIDELRFSPDNIVCDCDLSWYRNYLINYEGNVKSKFPSITCTIGGGRGFDVTDSNFCSASDSMMLECRACSGASRNGECNAMETVMCDPVEVSPQPLCLNEITYAGGQKRITKRCAGPSSCNSEKARNRNTCYSGNPTRCVYCCRGALCNNFETAVLENYFPPDYPFRPTTPVPTTTLPATTDISTTSKFTTTTFMTSLVPTTQAPSTLATTFPTTTERTTIPTTSETTKMTTTFPPTTEKTTSPTTTIQTTIPTTTPKFTTMEPTTTTATTMQPTTTTVTTTQATTSPVTTMQPTTTTVTTMQPTTSPVTTIQPTTTTVTTMHPTTSPATTIQPTTTTVTTMQPTTTTVTTMQPTTTTVTTMQPTTTTVTTMQPTTTTVTTMQPTTPTITTLHPTTTMQPPTTTVTTMRPTTKAETTMQPTTKTATTVKAMTSQIITTQTLKTTASTTQPETTTVTTTNQQTTKVTTKQPKTTTNSLTTSTESKASSTTQRTTITTTEDGNPTTPDLTTSFTNIVETTTATITTTSSTTREYSCPQEEQSGRYGDLQWPVTRVDSVAIIECPFNLEGLTADATRKCVLRGQSVVWMDPNLSNCSSNSEVLEKLAHENVTTENVVEIANELAEVTDESDTLEESDVENAVTVIESVSKVVNDAKTDTEREDVLDDIIETVNHLSQVEDEQLTEAQRAGNTSSRIIQAVENTIMSIEIQGSEYDSSSELEALAVKIIKLNNETKAENIRFPNSDAEDGDEDDNEERDDTEDSSSQTYIEIPESVVRDARRVQFILYKDTSLFEAILTAGIATTPRSECADDEPCVIERQALRSFVISASIDNRTVTNLDTPIVNTFTHLTDDDEEFANNSQCVFWDFAAAGGRGDWSTEGCSVHFSESNVTVCHCTHLTNFALLLDIYGNVNEISEEHQRIITYISIGGVALSFFCLVLALVSYSCAPRLRADKRVKVLLNLMVALMLMNMVFLFDSMVSSFASDSKYLCFGAAIAMHYTLLCVMTWMAIEAFTMYLALVRVFDSKQRHFILKVFFLGWGVPAIIVGASVGVDRENYGYHNNLCYLNRISFFISFFVPACIVLIWNSTVYVLVSRQMCRLRKRQTEFSQTFSLSDQLRASFSLTFLLGLTWLFGFFSFGELNLTFTYLFAITNALQGGIVFLFHCVFKKEIRRQWHALCCPCIPMLKEGDDGTGTYSRSRSGTNGSNGIRHNTLLSNRREYDPVNMPSGRSTRSRSWFWQPDHRRRSVAESTTTDMTRLSAVGSEIASPTSTVDVRSSRGGRNSHTTTFAM